MCFSLYCLTHTICLRLFRVVPRHKRHVWDVEFIQVIQPEIQQVLSFRSPNLCNHAHRLTVRQEWCTSVDAACARHHEFLLGAWRGQGTILFYAPSIGARTMAKSAIKMFLTRSTCVAHGMSIL